MKLALLLFTMSLTFALAAQQHWGRNTESEFTNEAFDIEIDANGNSYITGYITGETAFDVNVIQTSAAGNGDIYVAKYNSNGGLSWIKQFGGNFSDRAYDLALDLNGDIYVTGQFFGSVDFGGTLIQSVGNSKDIFLMKLDPNGNVLWARSEGGADSENAYGITTDNQNNVILTGQFTGTADIAGQTFSSYIDPQLNVPSNDLFVSKYDSNGNPLWVMVGQAEYEDRGLALHTDSQNNIFVTGQFSDTLLFDNQQFNNNGYNVGFLAKVTPGGQLLWLNKLRAGMVMPYDLEINSNDEVVVIGDFRGNMQYTDAGGLNAISNPHSKQIFALKTDNNGMFIWSNTLGSENDLSARSISIDSAKDIYITGYFKCDWTELQTQESIFNSVGFKDPYLWKMSDLGVSDYIKQFGGKKDDEGHGVAIKGNNQPVLCGSYTEDLNIMTDVAMMYSTSVLHYDLIPYSGTIDAPHVYLWGDASRNSFITNAVQTQTPTYNFFDPQGLDSLYGHIMYNQDTVHFCPNDTIWYDPNTFAHSGPGYNYDWSNGQTAQGFLINQGGLLDVQVERWDQCSFGGDTIFAIVHPIPNLPLMTDDIPQAVNAPGPFYQQYHFCHPDTLNAWFTNLDPGNTIEISSVSYSYTDTFPHQYYDPGTHSVVVSDGLCDNIGWFEIFFDYALPHDVIPYLVMVDNVDFNDSIVICDGDPVDFNILDSLNNPNGTFWLLPDGPVANYSWSVAGGGMTTDTFDLSFFPSTTGWYTVTYIADFGYDNLCGIDTTHYMLSDSFYIEVLASPVGSVVISGDNLLCPDGSILLTIPNTLTGMYWMGPGINWTSPTGDTVQITEAGIYHYQGYHIDTVTGCSFFKDFTFEVEEKLPPNIQANPSDGIVCPNDSVSMWIDDIFFGYSWTGPSGDSLAFTYDYMDDDQGFYYVTAIDSVGCILVSPPFEIREYTTPYLAVEPANVICDDEYVEILAIFSGDGQASWTSPIVSNNQTISTNQSGWYYCDMVHCGITVSDSIEIIDGSYSVTLNVSDSVLCFGEQATISTSNALGSYEWSNGDFGMPTIFVEDEGEYWVSTMNSYGCEANSDTVFIDFVEGSMPPAIDDIVLCEGDDLNLINPNAFPVTEWYSADTTLINSSQAITVMNVLDDTTFYAMYNIPQCPNSFDVINVTVVDSIANYYISGEAILCEGATGTYSINTNGEDLEWFIDNVSVGTSNPIDLTSLDFSVGVLQAQVSNSCFTSIFEFNVQVVQPESLDLLEENLTLCNYDSLSLQVSGAYSIVHWNGFFGQTTGTSLDLGPSINEGYISVYAEDLNGCTTNADSVFISISTLPYSIDLPFGLNCEGESIELTVSTSADSVLWSYPLGTSSDDTLSIVLSDSTAGTYYLTLWDDLGCVYEDSTEVAVNPLPVLNMPDDTILCMRDYLGGAYIVDSTTLYWQVGSMQDSVLAIMDGWYIVTAVHDNGCAIKDSIYVDVVDCNEENMPNVFTPNNDGVNDYFVIDEAPLYPNNTLIIMNRWGNVIYEEDGYNNTYGGEGLHDGTYFYLFYREGQDVPEVNYSGYVTLIR
ncbi:MAG: gliding motility-associated C-terminal domain-containing protein [Crocinitomicaceae bacterium]|nr:gliding motility-associated C-terminal domain-containing protein [Crocinitomicaceae bacterium]